MTDIRPKLRSLDVRPVAVSGRPALLLRDPLQLSEGSVVVPHEVAPLLALSDGKVDKLFLVAVRGDRGFVIGMFGPTGQGSANVKAFKAVVDSFQFYG